MAAETEAAKPQPSPPADKPASAPASNPGSAGGPAEPAKTATPGPDKPAGARPVVPSFDVVRVEPSGESVIAGRGAPGATVDLISNGSNLARAVADPSGLFAFVPPKLSPGSHEITLQTIAPDGARARSAQSVTVVVPEKADSAPLVAVATPGQPTVVLSRPEDKPAPDRATVAAAEPAAPGQPAQSAPNAGQPAQSPGQSAPIPGHPAPNPGQQAATPPQPVPAAKPDKPAPRPEVRIATVEAEGTGRLFVSGTAAPGATLRLYLNDSFVAPGGTGPQGQVSFTIERGIRPGEYKVRLDDVDPVNGAVRSRAEVPFSVPQPTTVAAAEQGDAAEPATAQPGTAPASPAKPAARRSSVARAFPPAPSEGSTGSSPATPSQPTTSAAATAATPPATSTAPAQLAAKSEEGPGFASREERLGSVVVPEIATTIVSRGDNLWRISKRTYGRGMRYTVIYDANQPQISDPSLIYPGQVFVLPPGESQAAR